jgi:hypothetical protein
MRTSTISLLVLGAVLLAWFVPFAIYDQVAQPPGWNRDFIHAVIGIYAGLFCVGAAIFKWFSWDSRFNHRRHNSN